MQMKARLTPGFLLHGGTLFPGGLAQCVVDAVLPAGTAFPEKFQHILVDAQRHLFLHAWDNVLLRRRCRDLGGDFLERGFGLAARIVQCARSSRLIGHFTFPSKARLSDDVPKARTRWRLNWYSAHQDRRVNVPQTIATRDD